MIRSKKIWLFVCSLMLVLASILFVACGKLDYSKTYLTSSADGDFVELFVNDTQELTITVQNPVKNMNKGLTFSSSKPDVAKIERIASQGSTTTYNITGLEGGTTSVEFITIEGRKSLSITIQVREYSNTLTKSNNGLYVSATHDMSPTSSDFIFKENATEKDLKYYFYGEKKSPKPLTIEDITLDEELVNSFVNVSLFNSNDKNYLIFKDENGNYFTLGKSTLVVESENTKYSLVAIEATENGQYNFNVNDATAVEPGMKFTFMAYYVSVGTNEGDDQILTCERDFSVLIDIDKDKISHEFGYHIDQIEFVPGNEATLYKIEENDFSKGKVVLIPSYTTEIEDRHDDAKADYKIAHIEVKVPKNQLLKCSAQTRDTRIATATITTAPEKDAGDYTTYYVTVSIQAGGAGSTYYDLQFYYEGFENNNDEKVNYTYSIPVEVRIKPTDLRINNEISENVYKFYNHYVSDAGWQEFNFSIIPEGAEYTHFKINIDNLNLSLKYKNITYTSGDIEITDLKEPVYMRGNNSEKILGDNSEVKNITVTMDFDIIRPDKIEKQIHYKIVNGVSQISSSLEKEVVIERYDEKFEINQISTDAEFASLDFKLEKGADVVNFEYNKEDFCEKDQDKVNSYKMKFFAIPKAVGSGTYTITLDNGMKTSITITVREELKDLAFVTEDEGGFIHYINNDIEHNNTTIYLYNKNGQSYFDMRFIANNDINSQAIISIEPETTDSSITHELLNNGKFIIHSTQNGSYNLVFKIKYYNVEKMTSIEEVKDYTVNLVTFDWIEDLKVYKLKDGFKPDGYEEHTSANYLNVYSSTQNEELRSAQISTEIKNTSAYLFFKPNSGEGENYEEQTFSKEYLYFTAEGVEIYQITSSGRFSPKDGMSYSSNADNSYNIGSFGTFNTDTLTFVALPQIKNGTTVRIIAHVRQYNKYYSFPINIKINIYNEVEAVSLQNTVSELTFSSLKQENSVIAFPTNSNATNGTIVALIKDAKLTTKADGAGASRTIGIFDDEVDGTKNITYVESAGKTEIKFKVNSEFLKGAQEEGSQHTSGEIQIVAKDWIDSNGNFRAGYDNRSIVTIKVDFADGTPEHRFPIEDEKDLLKIKDNLKAHYVIVSDINASSISSQLPLGKLEGSIIGTNYFSGISGLNISRTTSSDSEMFGGLFTSLGENAYIEYLQFSGSFNLDLNENSNTYKIGLIAGENKGRLTNVGVTINASKISISTTNNVKFGGLVGVNSGNGETNGIFQDFTVLGNNSPRISVFMNDFVNITVNIDNGEASGTISSSKLFGGLVGENNGTIRKVDNDELSLAGYSNYMAYVKIKTVVGSKEKYNENYLDTIFTGGLVGKSTGANAEITGGIMIASGESNKFIAYKDVTNSFSAGDGIVAGGEVWGYGYVGGIAGSIDGNGNSKYCGITSRVFVRGTKFGNKAPIVTLFANTTISGISQIAIQAIDDGKVAEESAMILFIGVDQAEGNGELNHLVFGKNQGSTISNENVVSYVQREYLEKKEGELTISTASNSVYYGDYLYITVSNGVKNVKQQGQFTHSAKGVLTLSANFDNQLTTNSADEKAPQVFFTYYFKIDSMVDKDSNSNTIALLQANLDSYLNRLTPSSQYYPFKKTGEMTFVSHSTDILTIDQVGNITIKKAGLARISAVSILNSNETVSFYIYVVNYFDRTSENSIFHSTATSSSTPLDQTTILIRGNNSATIYVIPEYKAEIIEYEKTENEDDKKVKFTFNSDKDGFASFNGVAFYLAQSTEITAGYEITELTTTEETLTLPSTVDVEIIGQTITFRRADSTVEGDYKIKLSSILKVEIDGAEYSLGVNKTLENFKVNYKRGALDITRKNYDEVPIITSQPVKEEITIRTTDEDEAAPNYYILGLDNVIIQGNLEIENFECPIQKDTSYVNLFKVTFTPIGNVEDNGDGSYNVKFRLSISVDTNSTIYGLRHEQNIYGRYQLVIQATSGKQTRLYIDFEQTGVKSIIIDNYTSLNDVNENSALTSTSDLAYPGVSGVLVITINPEDSDFDYILIDNDPENYQNGRAVATFSLLAKSDSTKATAENPLEYFEAPSIQGQVSGNQFRVSLNDVTNIYNKNDNYVNFEGKIYIRYDMSSLNVEDLSKSRIIVTTYKGNEPYPAKKDLTVKLLNYVTVEIDGKEGTLDDREYHMSYQVARGMSYKLNINSYGFRQDNIKLVSSNTNVGTIEFRQNGVVYDEYREGRTPYLVITSDPINYTNESSFYLTISASQNDGDIIRTAESKTSIKIYEYIVNYSDQQNIIKNMSGGQINVQVGTKTTFEVDMYDFIEYNPTIPDVVNKVDIFMSNLTQTGTWTAITNLLLNTDQPNNKMADENNTETSQITLEGEQDNYYFTSDGLSVIPKRTHVPAQKFYYFTFKAYFKPSTQGIYEVVNEPKNEEDKNSYYVAQSSFVLNVFSSSSAESPLPIYTYDDFISMQEGGYYILLNDITLPSSTTENATQFTPIVGNFASFDGNGHAINLSGVYDMGDLSDIGIFSSIEQGSIVKNLIVNLTAPNDASDVNADTNDTTYALAGLRTVKFVTTAENFTFGTITASNMGIITNCKVISNNVLDDITRYYLTIKADQALERNCYIGGLVGNNNGFITNCGVSINVKMPFGFAGIAAQNYNKISGCYVDRGIFINNSQYSVHNLAGFVLTNSESGKIIESYISGKCSDDKLYSEDEYAYIHSTYPCAGFVFTNAGYIKDCYTNIDQTKTNANMAGFANTNSGTIRNCFSLSKLNSSTTTSAGFARERSGDGRFENCYYIYEAGKLNDSLYQANFDGIERLTSEQFKDIDTYFKDYSYDTKPSTKSVWFIADNKTSDIFVDYVPTTEKVVLPNEGGTNQTNTVYTTEHMKFTPGRLELVSPNVRALSVKDFSYSTVNEDTDETIYFYLDDKDAPDRGSIHNPYLISDSTTMENEILSHTATNDINSSSYRIISDVSYIGFNGYSKLFTVTFAGLLEGNGMNINGISLVFMETRQNGGMFSQIGYSASKIGVVKNLTIAPKELVFNNTNNVGILAGTLSYGYIYDITVDSVANNLSSISGLHFVGGIIGKAVNDFEAKDIYSNVNVLSVYSTSQDAPYDENYQSETSYSYSGGLFGFVGRGRVYNAHVYDVTSVSGGRVGLLYGGIGSGAKVDYSFAEIPSTLRLKAKNYAGFIAGEVAGTLNYAYVEKNKDIQLSTAFATIPTTPTAVGGITGILNGGTISNALMEQGFIATIVGNELPIDYVGGISGIVNSSDNIISTLKSCVVNANFTTSAKAGGAVGSVRSALKIDEVAVKSTDLIVQGQRTNPVLGGIVGEVIGNLGASIDMKNSYCLANLTINTYSIGITSAGYAGGLIASIPETIIPKLQYCYTTSKINATIYDMRAEGTAKNYDATALDKKSNFDYKINSNFDSVYYQAYGSDVTKEKKAEDTDNSEGNENALFKTKIKNVNIDFTVNNFGKSSNEYASDLNVTAENGGVKGTSKERFYNLFNEYYYIDKDVKVDYEIKPQAEGVEEGGARKKGEYTALNACDKFVVDYAVFGKEGGSIYRVTETEKDKKFDPFTKGELDNYTKDVTDELKEALQKQLGEDKKLTEEKYCATVDFKELLKDTIYKGSDGNYYKFKVVEGGDPKTKTLKIENVATGQQYEFKNKDGTLVVKYSNNKEITLSEFWITSFTGYSKLAFEDSFTWINSL